MIPRRCFGVFQGKGECHPVRRVITASQQLERRGGEDGFPSKTNGGNRMYIGLGGLLILILVLWLLGVI